MEEEVHVDMDGQAGTATAPDWLVTLGVSSCVAVGVMDDASQKAWLIHSPIFAQNTEALAEMLGEATSNRTDGSGLRISACGGEPADANSEDEARRAIEAVACVLGELTPKAEVEMLCPRGGDVELLFDGSRWVFSVE